MKAVVIVAGDEARMAHHRRQERQVVADALELEGVERAAHAAIAAWRSGPQAQSLAIIGS